MNFALFGTHLTKEASVIVKAEILQHERRPGKGQIYKLQNKNDKK